MTMVVVVVTVMMDDNFSSGHSLYKRKADSTRGQHLAEGVVRAVL